MSPFANDNYIDHTLDQIVQRSKMLPKEIIITDKFLDERKQDKIELVDDGSHVFVRIKTKAGLIPYKNESTWVSSHNGVHIFCHQDVNVINPMTFIIENYDVNTHVNPYYKICDYQSSGQKHIIYFAPSRLYKYTEDKKTNFAKMNGPMGRNIVKQVLHEGKDTWTVYSVFPRTQT